MANPQKENGFTSIANELLEAIYKHPFNGTQIRIILCVVRSTYGYQKKSHEISISYLVNALGMKKGQYKQIKREVDSLISKNVLKEEKAPTKSTARVISLNKNYKLWSKKSSGLNSPVVELDHSTSGLISPVKKKDINKDIGENVEEQKPVEEPPKKPSKPKKEVVNLEPFIKAYTDNMELQTALNQFAEHRKSIKKPLTELAFKMMLKKLDTFSDKIGSLNESIMNGWQGVFETKKKNQKYEKEYKNPYRLVE